MSKVVVYVLDKIVWMLLITAVATQALQIVGIVNPPNEDLGEISYEQDKEYDFQINVGDIDTRGKRQIDRRSQLMDNLFNIPVSTLDAVNHFLKSTEPLLQNSGSNKLQNREIAEDNESLLISEPLETDSITDY